MTSRRKGLPCASVKFLRASSTLETFITQSKNSETTNCQLSSLSGEEARQFYESLLKEENEKETRNQQDCRNTQPKRKFMESYSNGTREMNSLRKRQKDSTLQAENNSRQLNYFLKMAQDGNIDRLRGVIRAGQIDINTTDQFGWTALMCACHSGQKACVKFLLQQGARDDLCNSKGQTAEDIAKRAGAGGLLDVFQMHKNKRKQVPSVKNSSSANPVEESLCKICKSTFSGRRQEHNRSTVHLFNCQYKSERTLYHIPESNIGFQLLKKKGWNQEKGLGPEGTGRKFPVKTILKQDRLGLGSKQKSKSRVTHFSPKDSAAVVAPKQSYSNSRIPRRTPKRKMVQDQIKERKWEHDMRVYMNTE